MNIISNVSVKVLDHFLNYNIIHDEEIFEKLGDRADIQIFHRQ